MLLREGDPMLARLATFSSKPADVDDANVALLRETIKSTPGFIAGFHFEDTDTGTAYSLTVFEDSAAVAAARDALAARPTDKRIGVDPETVQFLAAREF
jgi:hypothetical protein